MTKTLREKIAREYIAALIRTGEPKRAVLCIKKKWGVSRASIYAYVE